MIATVLPMRPQALPGDARNVVIVEKLMKPGTRLDVFGRLYYAIV